MPVPVIAVKVGVQLLQTPAGRRLLGGLALLVVMVPLIVILIAVGAASSMQTAAAGSAGAAASCEEDDADADGAIDCDLPDDTDDESGSSSGTGAGAWGGYANGRLPEEVLCPLSWAPAQRLRCDAAAALEELSVAYTAAFGVPISITDSYRDYDQQVRTKAIKGYLAATPGTSNHGWALAVDLGGGINVWGTPQRNWMVANAPSYGWVSPSWAQVGALKNEPWHWEYVLDTLPEGVS